MSSKGANWQDRLEAHFSALRSRRPGDRAVFALEHGLQSTELEEMRRAIPYWPPSAHERSRDWLLWVVHAAEVAYAYSGEEYWQSFESQTPGWDDASRPFIRSIFERFVIEYGGPRPRGPWAETFTIISWPITNAILPTDLQRHLARALYFSRAGLAARLEDLDELGRYVAASGWEGSDRFRQLREQPALLGQIALALLRPSQISDAILLEGTLRRIAQDLEAQRAAASWLRGARNSVERTSFRLPGTSWTQDPGVGRQLEEQVAAAARLSSPRLLLRPSRAGGDGWNVWLRLPNLSGVAAVSPYVRDALNGSRCWAPASDTPVARRRLLFDSQELLLTRWPAPDAPLLAFDGLAHGLESALLNSWAAPATPTLFALTDDRGTWVASRAVRPGRTYVVAMTAPVQGFGPREIRSACAGVHLYQITVPTPLSEEARSLLRTLQLLPTRTTDVWPAGTVPVDWDGESWGQWLSSDLPLLGIAPDHDLQLIAAEMQDGTRAVRRDVAAGDQLFLALPHLQVGVHPLTIREVTPSGDVAARTLTIEIRDRRDLSSGDVGPLRLWMEPYSANLEDLWSGRSLLWVAGPRTQSTLSFTLGARPGGQPLVARARSIEVPMTGSDWSALVQSDLTSDHEVAAAYDRARWARVELDAGRFGNYAVEFERSLPPVRWTVTESALGYVLAVADDTESGLPPKVQVAPFQTPATLVPYEDAWGDADHLAGAMGGLYRADIAGYEAYVLVPPRPRVFRSFSELALQTSLPSPPFSASDLGRMLRTLCAWAQAHLPGSPLARAWRAQVVRDIHAGVVAAICGARWGALEATYRHRPADGTLAALAAELSRGGSTAGDAAVIVHQAGEMITWPVDRRIERIQQLLRQAYLHAEETWAPISRRKGDDSGRWAAEMCLRVATDAEASRWMGDAIDDALAFLQQWPLPLRVARFLALLSDATTEVSSEFPPLHGAWLW